ncbi:MAG: ATP-binding protein, partial [Paludibacter sp.]|nr:ATP-binding protein [Paludibacter sp.]
FILLLASVLLFDYIRYYFFSDKFTFNTFGIFLFILSLTTLYSSYQLSTYKKHIKYKIQAENILVNGNSENDPIAELLLEELDKNLRKDETLRLLIQNPNATDAINKHIYEKHLHGFWNKYNVQIYPVLKNSPETAYYIRFLEFTGKKLKETGFYSLPASLYDMSFIGLIDLNQERTNDVFSEQEVLVFEFQPKRNFRSYSFPDLLISKEADILKQTNISIAKYENAVLIYSDLKFDWFDTDLIFHGLDDGFEKIQHQDRDFYVFTKADTRIIITEIIPFSFRNLIFYSLFIILTYLLTARIIFWIFEIRHKKRQYVLGMTSKFQLVFISLLFTSFISILIFSVNYIRNNYQQEQISNLEKKKQYIQKSLQDLYYWIEDISGVDEQSLNNNLQELAYRYQTDINIYDNTGKLIGSSQSLIFSKNLISNRMSPEVFFTNHTMENQYEHIGELAYLAAYTDLINGDFLQIGYISIPQYFSQTEISAKIEQFLGAIIQIYLIIIILSIILILITGRQLAEPLHQLESKMKSMRLGGKNEKVEYKSKDEVGQLVEQYNRTVDELEKSTQLLLASERETAWRTMARQVAHEINNPLTPMKLTIQQLQRTKKIDPDQFDGYFEKAAHTLVEQIDNLSRIAGTFSQFARMPETKFTEVDVAKKLVSVVNLFKHNFKNIQYTGHENNVIVSGDAEQIIQVFNNILKNATQAIKKRVNAKIDVELKQENNNILITFTDNGSGIPETIRENIFKPNFTTKSTGMGLGLSISKSIIENMGGRISFSTKEDEGTRFEISLNKK